MKKLIFLLFFISATLFVPSKIHAEELQINLHKQHTPVWCWAATIAMVVEYMHDKRIEDCEVLSAYDSYLGGQGACCFGDRRCVRTGGINEMKNIMGNIFHLQGQYYFSAPNYQEIIESIDNHHPIIAQLQNPYQPGHVVVVAGYKRPNNVIVLDPIQGKLLVSYNSLLANNPYGKWVGSFLITGKNESVPPVAKYCYTYQMNCPMRVAVPVGSSCSCLTPWGPIQGIAK